MRTIARFPVYPEPNLTLHMPAGAELLSVSLNIHQYFAHAICDLTAPVVPHVISAYYDEKSLPEACLGRYLNSTHQSGDQRMWHWFDLGARSVSSASGVVS